LEPLTSKLGKKRRLASTLNEDEPPKGTAVKDAQNDVDRSVKNVVDASKQNEDIDQTAESSKSGWKERPKPSMAGFKLSLNRCKEKFELFLYL